MKRQTKVMSIVAVAVCVVALTVGFAAFSNTLTIQSGATVKPDASTFAVRFSSSKNSVVGGTIKPSSGVGDDITMAEGATTISGLKAAFTEPGQSTTYKFYIHNTGKYDAYLYNITNNYIEGTSVTKRCRTVSGKENPLLDAVCRRIMIVIASPNGFYEGNSYGEIMESGLEILMFEDWYMDNHYNNIDNNVYSNTDFSKILPKETNNVAEVEIRFEYNDNGEGDMAPRIDEDIIVEFGNIDFVFSSLNPVKTINES